MSFGKNTDPALSRSSALRGYWRDIDESAHFVQFYDHRAFLLDIVSRFLAESLSAGDGAIVVATRENRKGLEERLNAGGLDTDQISLQGRYVTLDAAETLSKFMISARPDEVRFAYLAGDVIARAREASSHGKVRAFGEMVALLWADGNRQGAVHLEELWNNLAKTQTFSLCCAYPLDSFRRDADGDLLRSICAEHSRVIPAESYVALATREERLRSITYLQHRAKVLESEGLRRREFQQSFDFCSKELTVPPKSGDVAPQQDQQLKSEDGAENARATDAAAAENAKRFAGRLVEVLARALPKVPESRREAIAKGFVVRTVRRRGRIAAFSTSSNRVYLVLSGQAKHGWLAVRGVKKRLLAILSSGDFFGISALLPDAFDLDRPFSGTYYCDAVTDCVVAEADPREFIESSLGIEADLFVGTMSRSLGCALRLAMLHNEIAGADVNARLLGILEELASKFGVRDSRGLIINITLTVQDLAALTGASRQKISAHLSALMRDGVLTRECGRFILKTKNRLAPASAANQKSKFARA